MRPSLDMRSNVKLKFAQMNAWICSLTFCHHYTNYYKALIYLAESPWFILLNSKYINCDLCKSATHFQLNRRQPRVGTSWSWYYSLSCSTDYLEILYIKYTENMKV